MKFVLVLAIICVSSLLVQGKPKPADDMYTTEYDHINVEEILHSKRMLKNYMNCVMDRGKCTPDGAELKRNLKDAMETKCSKCSEKQKQNAKKILKFLHENEPGYCKELREKYDPDGKYYEQLKEYAKKEGIELKD